MQRCTITGNIASIYVKEEGAEKMKSVKEIKPSEKTKVLVSIAEHYWSKEKQEEVTRFVSLSGFLPANLKLYVGQLLQVNFNIRQKDGAFEYYLNVTRWEVGLRSPNRKDEAPAVEDNKAKAKAKTKAKAKAQIS